MSKYIAKATVWFSIDSDYPADGLGEAKNEIRGIVKKLNGRPGVKIAHATEISIKKGNLSTFESESDTGLRLTTLKGQHIILDDGLR